MIHTNKVITLPGGPMAADVGNKLGGMQSTGAEPAEEQIFFDVDIREFGAVSGGDGLTALQLAYNALPPQGGRIIVPAGDWLIPSDFDIEKPRVHLIGGKGSRLIKIGTDHHVVRLGPDAQHCRVEGLEIDGNHQAQGSLILVNGRDNLVFDNWLHDNGVMGDGPYANQSHGVCLDGQTSTCVRNRIIANHIEACHDIGCSENTAPDNRIVLNEIIGCGLEGVTIDVNSHRAKVLENQISGCAIRGGVGGIGIDSSDLWEVSLNLVQTTQAGLAGIKTQNNVGPSNWGTMVGNVILDNGGWGIWLFNNGGRTSSKCTLTANIVRGNPTGSIRFDAGCDNNYAVANPCDVAVSNGGAGNVIV